DREPMRLSAAAPDRLRRMLQGDLDTILAKALKSDQSERYASVAEFSDDLRRFIEHLPISARADAFGYRAAKFARRHERVLAATTVVATLVSSLVVFYTARLSTERDRARLEAARSS